MAARETLMAAAERLFAQRGIDSVSLREITREAGERNATALQYHFSDREGLLREILLAHVVDVSARAHALMDGIESRGGADDAREVVQVVALPLLHKLQGDGGGDFLQIAAQLVSRAVRTPGPDDPLMVLVDDEHGSLRRWARMIEPFMPEGAPGRPLHQRFAVLRFAYTELGRRAREPRRSESDELFGAHLVDLMTAIAVAAPSARTKELLQKRSAPRTTG